ncbi:MAG: aminopeptidase P family protein [Clostridiales bacterium]|jgi:Xaa-Pro aminopeptidase|nr:aminopeptidase P family protein [Clostridiales bacterium]
MTQPHTQTILFEDDEKGFKDMTVSQKIAALRERMAREKIDMYIITKFDPHQSEIASEYWNAVKYISGFTGSSAEMAVTSDYAGLWTDGRYYVQAERELAGSEIALVRATEPGVKDILTFAQERTPSGGAIGFDGYTLSAAEAAKLRRKIALKQIRLQTGIDLVGEIWPDRPAGAKRTIVDHPTRFCGQSRRDKLERVRAEMAEQNADVYPLSALDDIAWLMNLRGIGADTELGGAEVLDTEVLFPAYAVIEKEKVVLFVDADEVAGVNEILRLDGVELKEMQEIGNLAALDPALSILINPERASFSLYQKLEQHPLLEIATDITTRMKAVKNAVELACLEDVNIRDGAAMVRFLIWLKDNVRSGQITERDIDGKLRELRAQGENYISPSFDTIAAYMANAAMMHYHAGENAAVIRPEGLLLVDSGAHYWDGTTDITRTIVMGPVSAPMKRDFTLTLRSHTALASAVFLHGATGSNLDILARAPMWENRMDYKSGTGHGVGFCLNVHEGPHRISLPPNPHRLEPGMIVTNEPGVYRESQYGIRTENTLAVEEDRETEFGRFLKFRTISYCPIDLEGIDASMLNAEEKNWLNRYHAMTREKLSPCLKPEERVWLENATRAI